LQRRSGWIGTDRSRSGLPNSPLVHLDGVSDHAQVRVLAGAPTVLTQRPSTAPYRPRIADDADFHLRRRSDLRGSLIDADQSARRGQSAAPATLNEEYWSGWPTRAPHPIPAGRWTGHGGTCRDGLKHDAPALAGSCRGAGPGRVDQRLSACDASTHSTPLPEMTRAAGRRTELPQLSTSWRPPPHSPQGRVAVPSVGTTGPHHPRLVDFGRGRRSDSSR